MTSQQCLREAAVDIREVQRKVGEPMRRLPLLLLLSLATRYRADDGVASPSPVPAAAEQEPHLKFVSCDEMVAAGGEAWRELCVRGGCQPRADGGCRKRSASGDCSTFKGCVQGEFAGTHGDRAG